jgi:Endoribonuclease L-PSP
MSTRTPIDPWPWSLTIGFHQAELIQRPERILVCAGQTAMSADGIPQHVGDMAAQVELPLDNLEAVLDAAGMTLTNVVRLIRTARSRTSSGYLPCLGMTPSFSRIGASTEPGAVHRGIWRVICPHPTHLRAATRVKPDRRSR